MRFYFDIDDYEFEQEYGVDFKQAVRNGAVDALASQIYETETDTDRWYSEVQKRINEIVKSRQDEICEKIIERVAEKVAKKRAIVAITPKASEIAAADNDNIAYFEQMIDRAIAKRFGK
jgi:nitrogenase molybdenum-iron protein alpha/beta subunit